MAGPGGDQDQWKPTEEGPNRGAIGGAEIEDAVGQLDLQCKDGPGPGGSEHAAKSGGNPGEQQGVTKCFRRSPGPLFHRCGDAGTHLDSGPFAARRATAQVGQKSGQEHRRSQSGGHGAVAATEFLHHPKTSAIRALAPMPITQDQGQTDERKQSQESRMIPTPARDEVEGCQEERTGGAGHCGDQQGQQSEVFFFLPG